jgi:hypothetical protein
MAIVVTELKLDHVVAGIYMWVQARIEESVTDVN